MRPVHTPALFPVVGPGRVVGALGSWSPGEVVCAKRLGSDVGRLVRLEGRGLRWYHLELGEGQKPEEFTHPPSRPLGLVEKRKSQTPRRDTITKYAKEKDILRPKYVRIFAIRQIRRFFRRTGRSDVI